MFTELKLSYPVHFFRGHTPDMSHDYMNDRDVLRPEKDTELCCTRSHASAIKCFVDNYKDKDYLLVIEDDVTLLSENFTEKLEEVIEIWKKHETEIDYVSVGYLPNTQPHKSDNQDGVLKWNMTNCSVWGEQAYIMPNKIAVSMSKLLFQPTSNDLRQSVKTHISCINNGRGYVDNYLRLQIDAIMPMCFRQGIVWPLMGIEMPFNSLIRLDNRSHFNIWNAVYLDSKTINPELYYSKPTWYTN